MNIDNMCYKENIIRFLDIILILTIPGCKEDTVIPQSLALLCSAYIVIIYIQQQQHYNAD